MIKYEIRENDDGKKAAVKLEIEGSGDDLAADACLMIGAVYAAIAEEDEGEAEDFRRSVAIGLWEGSPAWDLKKRKKEKLRVGLTDSAMEAIREIAHKAKGDENAE